MITDNIEDEPIQVEDIVDFWMECRAAGDKRWTKLAHRALHGSVDDPVTSDAWEYVAEEIIERREREARLYACGQRGLRVSPDSQISRTLAVR